MRGAVEEAGMAGSLLTSWRDAVLNLLLPERCAVCGLLQEPVLCPRCTAQVARIVAPYCQCCGTPFDPRALAAERCVDCRAAPPPFTQARAAGAYGGELRTAVHRFKYAGIRALAAPLAALMAETVEPPADLDCLCPVPLHPAREALRGYNQSLLLAEELGRRWNLPVEAGVLTRIVNTTPQMQLPAEERRRNVRGAFVVAQPVKGRRLGLIDDVYTTGSTLCECSHMLARAGAARVLVFTVARTVHAPEPDAG